MRGKSITLFFMDGEPVGRVKCTLPNWTGVAYKIPRTDLEKCRGRGDLAQSGVYFLFGVSWDTGESVVYVGQAGVRKNGEGILYRLQEHKRNPDKDYWTEAVVFTTSNNSFGPTEISYLENRFCSLALEAKRYIVKNGNEPCLGNVTEEKESELEEFIVYARLVMGALGYKIFEPLISTATIAEDAAVTPELYCRRSGANAFGRVTSEGFVVLTGSKLRMQPMSSYSDSARKMREKYESAVSEDGILQRDILFQSPSGASCFVLMGSSNGYLDWCTEEGVSLKSLNAGKLETNAAYLR